MKAADIIVTVVWVVFVVYVLVLLGVVIARHRRANLERQRKIHDQNMKELEARYNSAWMRYQASQEKKQERKRTYIIQEEGSW